MGGWDVPLVQQLPGGRIHLQHGPIDVVLKAWGRPCEVQQAYDAAQSRFGAILHELVSELAQLRRAVADRPEVSTPVALRMVMATGAFPEHFITPMAAVAGAVADELLGVMTAAGQLDRAFVNDGGDIAIHLAPMQSLDVGVMGDFSQGDIPQSSGRVAVDHGSPVRGIASSGAKGRSFSLGISDSVTVLARTSAMADAAATLIANAVNLDDPRIRRRPAGELDPDHDLGDRLVTVSVPAFQPSEIRLALQRGLELAAAFHAQGLIIDAALSLQGHTMVLGARGLNPCFIPPTGQPS